MATFTVSLDLPTWPLPGCPGCGDGPLVGSGTHEGLVLTCDRCGARWCWTQGALVRHHPAQSRLPRPRQRPEEGVTVRSEP
jgi:hypothetical protein